MICERCGKQCTIRFFIPPFIRGSLVSNLKRGSWVCKECLEQTNNGEH